VNGNQTLASVVEFSAQSAMEADVFEEYAAGERQVVKWHGNDDGGNYKALPRGLSTNKFLGCVLKFSQGEKTRSFCAAMKRPTRCPIPSAIFHHTACHLC
jgi:hypothetical protein